MFEPLNSWRTESTIIIDGTTDGRPRVLPELRLEAEVRTRRFLVSNNSNSTPYRRQEESLDFYEGCIDIIKASAFCAR